MDSLTEKEARMHEQRRERHEIAAEDPTLELKARELHEEFCRTAQNTSDSFIALAQVMAKIRDQQSWRYHSVGNSSREREYVLSVIGPIARSRYFQIAAAGTLTQGQDALPVTTV